jgi:hypothetical protein
MISIELGMDLINLIKGLANKNSDYNKYYFAQFIEPIWVSFNQVHQDYMDSFKKYSLICESLHNSYTAIDYITFNTTRVNKNFHPSVETAIKEIITDSFYTENLRIELNFSLKALPKIQNAKITHFLDSIRSYFSLEREIMKLKGFSELNDTLDKSIPAELIDIQNMINNFKLKQVRSKYLPNIGRYLLLGYFQQDYNPNVCYWYCVDFPGYTFYDPTIRVLEKLQAKYGDVAESYYLLRQSLLK